MKSNNIIIKIFEKYKKKKKRENKKKNYNRNKKIIKQMKIYLNKFNKKLLKSCTYLMKTR